MEYARRLAEELRDRAELVSADKFRTVYFGGGTPSMWSGEALRYFMAELGEAASQTREFTVEFNPECADPSTIDRWLDVGANRVSLGVQSVDHETLTWLGRQHDLGTVDDALRHLSQSGVEHVSVDVIYGVPTRGVDRLESELKELLKWDVIDHVSAYELTWESKTPLDAARKRGEVEPVKDAQVVEQFEQVHQTLTDAGFEHYEVSSYARPGAQALHNRSYWSGRPYLGIGVGAHSLLYDTESNMKRTSNVRALRKYLRDGHSYEEEEVLSAGERAAELCMLSLRTARGLHLSEVIEFVKLPQITAHKLEEACGRWDAEGFGEFRGDAFRPSARGFLYSDSLALEAMRIVLDK
jgi:oxygen-independent coproporphyrinogen-3 oxidase